MMCLRTWSALLRVSLSSGPIGEITKQGFFCDGSAGFVAAEAAGAACAGFEIATGHLGTLELAKRGVYLMGAYSGPVGLLSGSSERV